MQQFYYNNGTAPERNLLDLKMAEQELLRSQAGRSVQGISLVDKVVELISRLVSHIKNRG